MERTTIGNSPRLTELSPGSGCGCKISPADLEQILLNCRNDGSHATLLIGNAASDDASVIDIGDGRAIVCTTDFFTPIVDDPYDFGRVAAANALSDIYAMGGCPLTALSILGWPVERLGAAMAGRVIEGAVSICNEVGISLSGGHSIDSKEPFFGLAVTGMISHAHIKTNSGARDGDLIYLTKAIGTGMIATAIKRGLATKDEDRLIVKHMCRLNKAGEALGKMEAVHAMTDVTGFGLLGHLVEMCEGSNLGASIRFESVPLIDRKVIEKYIAQFVMPDNTMRNFKAYHARCSKLNAPQLQVLCDPQTSGGLLIAVDRVHAAEFESGMEDLNATATRIGEFGALGENVPLVEIV